ncbi:hypothetical protein R5O87_04260 [Arthrobacter globiformis]
MEQSQAADSRGRYDSIGSTVYLADSRQCAYAEVLLGFRQQGASVAKAAESIGWTVDDYITSVRAQAEENGGMSPGPSLSTGKWTVRYTRSGSPVRDGGFRSTMRPPSAPWKSSHRPPRERLQLLTAGSLTGDDRDLTTLLSHVMRGTVLDDGSEPLGISYPSKTLTGRCWAYWDRRADEGLSPSRNGLLQLTSENVGPDPEFHRTAELYGLPVLGARP